MPQNYANKPIWWRHFPLFQEDPSLCQIDKRLNCTPCKPGDLNLIYRVEEESWSSCRVGYACLNTKCWSHSVLRWAIRVCKTAAESQKVSLYLRSRMNSCECQPMSGLTWGPHQERKPMPYTAWMSRNQRLDSTETRREPNTTGGQKTMNGILMILCYGWYLIQSSSEASSSIRWG